MNYQKNKWDNIFGCVDFSKFSSTQKAELDLGLEADLPIHLFANPSFTSAQMKDLRTMLETVLAAEREPHKLFAATEYGPEEISHGFISDSNFAHHPERVCYVPDNWDFEEGPGITGAEILELCMGDAIKAEMVFGLCEWQFPSSVLGEWDEDDERALEELRKERAEANGRKLFNVPELADALLGEIQSRLRDIYDTHTKLIQGINGGYRCNCEAVAHSLVEKTNSLDAFLKGASLSLPDGFDFLYMGSDDNYICLNYREADTNITAAFITANSFVFPHSPSKGKQKHKKLEDQLSNAKSRSNKPSDPKSKKKPSKTNPETNERS